MNQNPIYKIHGLERRKLKKELSELKKYTNNFWYYHQLDKDMCSFYNCTTEGYPMSDEEAQKKFDNTHIEIKKLEEKLSILFENN